jgi:hypothetical protein
MEIIQNTLEDATAGVDFTGTPTKGINKLISQFSFFDTATDDIQNSLTATDIIENSL